MGGGGGWQCVCLLVNFTIVSNVSLYTPFCSIFVDLVEVNRESCYNFFWVNMSKLKPAYSKDNSLSFNRH